MAQTSERLDKFHKAILQYINNNPNSTGDQIANAMTEKKICSRVTTLRKIDDLIDMQEIKDLLKKGESGFHKYSINENSQFNWIVQKLSVVEDLLDSVAELDNLIKQRRKLNPPDKTIDKTIEESNLIFEQIYFQTLNLMLIAILDKTHNVISSEKDSKILYEKNIQLLQRLVRLIGQPTKLYESYISSLKSSVDKLQSKIEKIEKISKSTISSKSEIKQVKKSLETLRTESIIFDRHTELANAIRSEFIKYKEFMNS